MGKDDVCSFPVIAMRSSSSASFRTIPFPSVYGLLELDLDGIVREAAACSIQYFGDWVEKL